MKVSTLWNSIVNRHHKYLITDLTEVWPVVQRIKHFTHSIPLSETELASIRLKFSKHPKEESLLRLFGMISKVCERELDLSPHDNQLLAGYLMYNSHLVELPTGEGKTLTAVFPAIAKALEKSGIFILTFNDYLAKRDATWMGPVYEACGLSVGYIQQDMTWQEKSENYTCDIIYTTAKELGFDFLRCQHTFPGGQKAPLPEFYFAIVDEADASLIDEGRHPLVLAGNLDVDPLDYHHIASLINSLQAETDYILDIIKHVIYLTDSGRASLASQLQIDDLTSPEYNQIYSAINLSLQAHHFLHKDVDYIIQDDMIILIDEFTGRTVPDRKWSNGLMTAVEAKENLKIQSEGRILDSISLQYLIHRFPSLAAMTATATPAAEEFFDFYGLKTYVIPPNTPCTRIDRKDLIYIDKKTKQAAIIEVIKQNYQSQRPVLVGTLTIAESEAISQMLTFEKIPHQVLNAKQDQPEADIIKNAGNLGAVTIATNMAGRGTDIKLGGPNSENGEQVKKLGGLLVIGTNKHESKRIDLQLRGRAGRQGDPGESVFMVSLQDDLMVRFQLMDIMPAKYHPSDTTLPITSKMVRKFVNLTQRIIEGRFYDMRKFLINFSAFTDKQRLIWHMERETVMNSTENWINDYQEFEIWQNMPRDWRSRFIKWVISLMDQYWSQFLIQVFHLKENIHVVRIGGEKPLLAFQKASDKLFEEIGIGADERIISKLQELKSTTKAPLMDVNIPTATWTFVINDSPFNDALAEMLMDNSNIGFQVDILSGVVLAIFQLWRNITKKDK